MKFIVTLVPVHGSMQEREEAIEADSVKLDSTWATFYRIEEVTENGNWRQMPVLHIAIPSTEVISIRREDDEDS